MSPNNVPTLLAEDRFQVGIGCADRLDIELWVLAEIAGRIVVEDLEGFLCGVAGVVLASYVGYGTIAAGQGYELDAIAACILGGTSPLGGVGTIAGALIGALIIGSLSTGLQMMNVAPAWQFVVKAIILVLAVLVDVYFKKNR